jgi:hypothetical protein
MPTPIRRLALSAAIPNNWAEGPVCAADTARWVSQAHPYLLPANPATQELQQ